MNNIPSTAQVQAVFLAAASDPAAGSPVRRQTAGGPAAPPDAVAGILPAARPRPAQLAPPTVSLSALLPSPIVLRQPMPSRALELARLHRAWQQMRAVNRTPLQQFLDGRWAGPVWMPQRDVNDGAPSAVSLLRRMQTAPAAAAAAPAMAVPAAARAQQPAHRDGADAACCHDISEGEIDVDSKSAPMLPSGHGKKRQRVNRGAALLLKPKTGKKKSKKEKAAKKAAEKAAKVERRSARLAAAQGAAQLRQQSPAQRQSEPASGAAACANDASDANDSLQPRLAPSPPPAQQPAAACNLGEPAALAAEPSQLPAVTYAPPQPVQQLAVARTAQRSSADVAAYDPWEEVTAAGCRPASGATVHVSQDSKRNKQAPCFHSSESQIPAAIAYAGKQPPQSSPGPLKEEPAAASGAAEPAQHDQPASLPTYDPWLDANSPHQAALPPHSSAAVESAAAATNAPAYDPWEEAESCQGLQMLAATEQWSPIVHVLGEHVDTLAELVTLPASPPPQTALVPAATGRRRARPDAPDASSAGERSQPPKQPSAVAASYDPWQEDASDAAQPAGQAPLADGQPVQPVAKQRSSDVLGYDPWIEVVP